jgi:Fe2+-dicitrate sensor, membrane component
VKTFPRKRPSEDATIEARAAAWLAQRDDHLSAAEQSEFEAWCAADPRHAAAVARLETTWNALRQLRDYRPTARAHPDPDILAPRRLPPLARFRRPFLLATAAALAVLAGWQWRAPAPALPPAQTETYTTSVGGYQRVTLADGSVVQLNDRSEIRVRFTPDERRLQLVRGQAHFTVAKNKSRPFIVQTHRVAVRAVGTAFDIRVGDSNVEVLVTEGVVQLDRTAPAPAQPAPASAAPLVSAGWRAVISHDFDSAPTLEPVSPSALREALSWQGPRLVFLDTPLAEVIAQFNRRNRVQICLGDPGLADLPVAASFRAENVEAFVRLLTSNGELRAEHLGDRIILHKAP